MLMCMRIHYPSRRSLASLQEAREDKRYLRSRVEQLEEEAQQGSRWVPEP